MVHINIADGIIYRDNNSHAGSNIFDDVERENFAMGHSGILPADISVA